MPNISIAIEMHFQFVILNHGHFIKLLRNVFVSKPNLICLMVAKKPYSCNQSKCLTIT